MSEVLYCALFFYLIYVLILFNGVDDVMLRNSYGLSIRGLAHMETPCQHVGSRMSYVWKPLL
jgi:hypothetical protein